MKEIYRTSST